jgi:molecular chaperone DnaK (HSP70)
MLSAVGYVSSRAGWDGYRIQVDDTELFAAEISAMTCRSSRGNAPRISWVKRLPTAVITLSRPTSRTPSAGHQTRQNRQASQTRKRIIIEPTARSGTGLRPRLRNRQTILVFDHGGGTFDVSILETRARGSSSQASGGNIPPLAAATTSTQVVEWM